MMRDARDTAARQLAEWEAQQRTQMDASRPKDDDLRRQAEHMREQTAEIIHREACVAVGGVRGGGGAGRCQEIRCKFVCRSVARTKEADVVALLEAIATHPEGVSALLGDK
jgi:hypothetical protein